MSGKQQQQVATPQQLEQACLAILNPPSNESIRQASQFLNKSAKKLQCIMPLHALLRHANPGVRQLSAIFLRKVIQRHWGKLGKSQADFRSSILKQLMQEPNRDVRNGLCELVAKVAKFAEWPDLIKFINQASTTPEAAFREVAFKLLDAMSETVGQMLGNSFAQLQPMLLKGLKDVDPNVRVRALRALAGIFAFLENERHAKLFKDLVEPCVAVTLLCIQNDRIADALQALELFNELLMVQEMDKAVSPFLPQLMQFMLTLVRDPKVDLLARDQAMTFIQNVAISRCKQFVSNSWLDPLLQVMVPMLNEPLDPEEVQDEDLTSQRLVVSCVDVLCEALPQSYVGPRMLQLALQLSKSQNWMERKGALEILAVATQGCFVFMQDHVGDYLHVLVNGFRDSSSDVRESACVALAHFSEKLGDTILPHHAQLVPLLVTALRDSESVAMRALYALQFFAEGLMSTFEPYADPFMTACLAFMRSPSPLIRETALGAMGSIAMAIKAPFAKYLPHVMPLVKHYMALTAEEDMELRARATEVAGTVSFCVGRAAMGPLLEELAALAFSAFADASPNQYELRQHAYGFFANLAEVLDLDFVKVLPQVIPFLVASLESDEGVVRRTRGEASGLEALVEDDEDDDDQGDDGAEAYGAGMAEGEKVNISVRVPFLEEKKMAIACAATIARVIGKHFALYLERLLPTLISLCSYLQAGVRENAVKALPDMMHVVNDGFPAPSGKWERGKFRNEKPLSQQVLNVLTPIMRTLLDVIKEDRDLEVVICSVESVDKVIQELGPCALEPFIEPLLALLISIFAKQSFCQALREQFDEDDRDLELFNVATDCVATLCSVAGPTSFGAELLKRVFPSFRLMMGADRPATYRALALGGLAEFSVHVEHAIQPCAVEVMKLALVGTSSDDVVTRRNAIYCVGAVIQFGGPGVAGAAPNVLTQAKTYYVASKDGVLDMPGRDNAAGALGRLVLSGIDGLPLPEIVGGIVQALPLQADTEPYTPIFQAMIKLLRNGPTTPLIAPHVTLLIQTAVKGLVDTKLKLIDKARATLEIFIRVMTMTPEHKQVLLNVLSQAPPAVVQEIKTKLGL